MLTGACARATCKIGGEKGEDPSPPGWPLSSLATRTLIGPFRTWTANLVLFPSSLCSHSFSLGSFHASSHALCVSVTQLCPTLCDPMDCSPPGFSLSMGFSRQEYWSRLPWAALLQGIFPTPGIEPGSQALRVDSLPSESPGKPSAPMPYRVLKNLDIFHLPSSLTPSSIPHLRGEGRLAHSFLSS